MSIFRENSRSMTADPQSRQPNLLGQAGLERLFFLTLLVGRAGDLLDNATEIPALLGREVEPPVRLADNVLHEIGVDALLGIGSFHGVPPGARAEQGQGG